SGVGRAVSQLGREFGWRTANVVRRPELIEELRAVGAGAVLLDDESLPEQLAAVTGGAPIPLALNAVGGDSALRLANALSPGGALITYGAMSRQSLRVPNGLLIFKDLRWRGFWITAWYDHAGPETLEAMFAELFALAQRGVLHTPVERIFPIEQAAEALARAQEGGRSGKILLGFDPALLSSAGR
ncbi:MAG: zinc-binding dehydrogenase, partial [Verrucomicrobiota bacterium]|nr:zinc-binding dehydrogenase [Verrucomicrobiota bacterium]